jgi:hypothetical protein
MLGGVGADDQVSERTLRLLWRRSEGFFATVKNIVVKVRQVRSALPLDEAILRFVLFPQLLPDIACKIPVEIVEHAAKLAENSNFRFLKKVRVEYLIDTLVPLKKRIEYMEHLATRERGPDQRDSRSIGFAAAAASTEARAEKSRLFLPLVSEDIRERLPQGLKEFIQEHVPRRLSVAIDDNIALCLLNMETLDNMRMLLQRTLYYLEHRENDIPKEHGVTGELLHAIECTIEEVSSEIIARAGDAFHASGRLQWFRPQPVTDANWQHWREILDRDCDAWLRVSCQELDPANEVTEEELQTYYAELQPAFLTEALEQVSVHGHNSQGEDNELSSSKLNDAFWSCVLRDEANRLIDIVVQAPFLDKRRLTEERARFPKELVARGREPIDDAGVARLFGAASVIFVLTLPMEAEDRSRAAFRRLSRELASAQCALRMTFPQAGRMLLVVPPSENMFSSNPSLRHYSAESDALFASRVRISG